MKGRLILRSLGLAFVLALAALLVPAPEPTASAGSALKGIIVELEGDPVAVAKATAEEAGQPFDVQSYRQQIVAEQAAFLGRLSAAGVQFSVAGVDAPNGPDGEVARIDFRYNYVLNGVALVVPEGAVEAVRATAGVKAVHNDESIQVHLDHGVGYTRAPQLYGNPPQIKMGDELRTNGVHGEGVYIAVLDTGVDWAHPMFGGDPTPPRFGVGPNVAAANANPKVPYYLNLTGGAVTDDFGHGSHVAGIAAGYLAKAPGPDGLPLTADDISVHGVAPQAKIMGYKVLSTVGSGTAASIIMAVEDAVQPFTIAGYPKPVAHVINLSLGSANNDPNYVTSIACDNATLAGATVVASAGNSGAATAANPSGEGTIGSPGSGRRVLTVGANIDPGSAPNKLDEVGGGNRAGMKAFPLEGGAAILSDITNNYVYCGFAETPDQVPDSVRGKVALIARGGSVNTPPESPVAAGTGLFSNKAAFAVAKGAVAVVIFNNVDGELTSATVRKSTVPVVGISKANGEYLRNAIGSAAFGAVSTNQIRLNRSLLFEPAMADFSSKGAVGGFGMVKPDITAPGVSVLSATVRAGGVGTNTAYMFDPTGYISASGTSMSSPMAAGVAALVKQKNPSWTPSMIRAAMMNTATNLRLSDGSPVADGAQTINQQGAGLIDAFAAANATALMGVGKVDHAPGSPTPRTYGVFVSTSPGNPDFLGSHSFGAVPIAGVIGTAQLSQTVTIFDVANGAGAGSYRLTASAVRNMPQGVSVRVTNLAGVTIEEVEVTPGGSARFRVSVSVNGESVPADPTQIEWYVTATRTDGGQRLRMPFYYRAVRPAVTANAPNFTAVNGTEVAGNPPVDINGSYQLQFAAPTGGAAPAQYRVQESADSGATWTTLADVPASQNTYDVAGRGNGTYTYRVSGLFQTQYGLLAGPASAARAVRVDRRIEADVTALVEFVNKSIVFSTGATELSAAIRNKADSPTIYPPARVEIVSIQSGANNVRVANADNGGDGVSAPAVFNYSAQVGQALTPGAESGARSIRFSNPSTSLFTFTARVFAHQPDAAGAAGSSVSGGETGTSGGGTGSGTSDGGTTGVNLSGQALQVTINPLTNSVTIQLVQ
jgi:subtilisin family serine protease